MRSLVFLFLIVFTSCSMAQDKTSFSKKALSEVMIDRKGNKISFFEILEKYKGKIIVIDVWASWCGDCVGGMPKVKELQTEYDDAVYLFLSLDKDFDAWNKGIERNRVEGEHYFVPAGWKSDFNNDIELDWIPRYIVLDRIGDIQLFKATRASDKKLEKAIKG